MSRVLCLITDGVEELELTAPVDLLRRAGVEVVIASLGPDRLVTGKQGIVLQADALLADVEHGVFDLLFLPGGPHVLKLREDGRASKLVARYLAAGQPVAAICAAPLLLADAGALTGKRFTAHSSVHTMLPGVLPEERVVEDGLIVTSRGPGTAVAFGLALVRRLCGEKAEAEVAEAVMV
jgi:4-methyl-5(b-hydroxyethyl)-thiazole monophosphate biosynthesis